MTSHTYRTRLSHPASLTGSPPNKLPARALSKHSHPLASLHSALARWRGTPQEPKGGVRRRRLRRRHQQSQPRLAVVRTQHVHTAPRQRRRGIRARQAPTRQRGGRCIFRRPRSTRAVKIPPFQAIVCAWAREEDPRDGTCSSQRAEAPSHEAARRWRARREAPDSPRPRRGRCRRHPRTRGRWMPECHRVSRAHIHIKMQSRRSAAESTAGPQLRSRHRRPAQPRDTTAGRPFHGTALVHARAFLRLRTSSPGTVCGTSSRRLPRAATRRARAPRWLLRSRRACLQLRTA